MNAKQIAPIVASLAPVLPPLLLIGGLVALTSWLLSDDDKKKPDVAPANTASERKPLPIPPNSGRNSGENRGIPANSSGKSSVILAPAPVPAVSASVVPKIPVPAPSVIPVVKIQPKIPPPAQKKFITREDMAKIFSGGNRGLTRKFAVAALKALGFGKSAAYEALAINGRFMPWLQFAEDGIITWKN